MDQAVALVRMVELCFAVAAVAGASLRLSSRITADAGIRVLGAATLGAAIVIGETLALGVVGLGTNGAALLLAAMTTWLAVRATVEAGDVPSLAAELQRSLRRLGRGDRTALAATVGAGTVSLGYLVWRPFMPYDALMYHLAEPLVWLHDGRPGALHVLNQDIPVEAYPKHTEVLVAWLLGLGHSAVVGTIVMFAFLALAAVATIKALTLLGVRGRPAALAAGAMLLLPVGVQQLSGVSTDLPALAWISVTGALCIAATKDVRVLPVAVVGAGLALGTKATTAPPVVAFLLATVVVLWGVSWGPRRPLVLGTVAGALLGGIWYVQNWIVFGAPLHPFYRFPDGPPTPPLIATYGASFRDDPLGAVRAATLHGYFDWFGGGLLLVAGLGVAVIAAVTAKGTSGRWLRIALVAAAVELALWASGPFTGFPGFPGTEWFPRQGVRYLIPGLPIVVLPLALATTHRQAIIRRLAAAVLILALLANVVAYATWGPPYGPSLALLGVGAGLGALVGWFGGRALASDRTEARSEARSIPTWTAALGGAAVVVVLLTVGARGHWDRSVAVIQPAETAQFAVPDVIAWIGEQPDWRHGTDPVAVGPFADALLAGPALEHDLTVVTQTMPCAAVRLLHDTHWLVLADVPAPSTDALVDPDLAFDRARCLDAVAPTYRGGGYLVYRPTVLSGGGA